MVDVETKIQINCPRKKVAEYATNPDNAPKWYVNINSVEWKTEKPLSLASQVAFTAQFLGRDISYVYEIVELIPLEKLVMRTIKGPFPMETTYLWKEIDENTTEMILRNKGNPKGFSKLFSPLIASKMKKANNEDLKSIKNILES